MGQSTRLLLPLLALLLLALSACTVTIEPPRSGGAPGVSSATPPPPTAPGTGAAPPVTASATSGPPPALPTTAPTAAPTSPATASAASSGPAERTPPPSPTVASRPASTSPTPSPAGRERPTKPEATSEVGRSLPVLVRPEAELPPLPGETQAAVKPTTLQFILDASGSMNEPAGNTTKLIAARQALQQLVSALPLKSDQLHVGLRAYGTHQLSDDARSCQDTELLVPLQGVDKEKLRTQIEAINAVGNKTPMAYAVEQAARDFAPGERQNVIILVSDGIENCAADRVGGTKAATATARITVHVVGFGIEAAAARDQLQAIAAGTGGLYVNARTPQELAAALQKLAAEQVQVVAFRGNAGQLRVEQTPGTEFWRWQVFDATGKQIIEEFGTGKIKGVYPLPTGFYRVNFLAAAGGTPPGGFLVEVGAGQESVLRLGGIEFVPRGDAPWQVQIFGTAPTLGSVGLPFGSGLERGKALAVPAATYRIGSKAAPTTRDFATIIETVEVKPNTIVRIEV